MFDFSPQDEQADLVNEVLKVLYNLVLHIDKTSPDEEEDSHCLRLISILRSLLLASCRCPEKTDSLHRSVEEILFPSISDMKFTGLSSLMLHMIAYDLDLWTIRKDQHVTYFYNSYYPN